MNGLIDIGQTEGAFIMGLGFWLLEKMRYDPSNGRCLTNGTWGYYPPLSKDIPVDFRVSLLENSDNPEGVHNSKLVGEPPLCLTLSAFFALRKAIESARSDAGNSEYFQLNAPCTPEVIQLACLADSSNLKFN